MPGGQEFMAERIPGKAPAKAVQQSGSVRAFLDALKRTPPAVAGQGRLIFALDATISREPTWDMACAIQANMFEEAGASGRLSVQLAYFRGFNEFAASPWTGDARSLAALMTGVQCRGGYTQIGRVLSHAVAETRRQTVRAVVYVGDAFEEDIDHVSAKAGELGLLGVPVFTFHEGGEAAAARAFKEIARLTRGAYCAFDAGAARQLRELLRAVAAYAAGGRTALEAHGQRTGGSALKLLAQMR